MENLSQDPSWASFDNTFEDEQSLDIWGFLKRRMSFIIVLAVVGGFLGYLFFQRQVPVYKSSALLQVVHHNSDAEAQFFLVERSLPGAQFVINK